MLVVRREGLRQDDDLARPARRERNPRGVALTPAIGRSTRRSRPTSTRSRARCDSSASLPPNARATSTSRETSSGQASPSARARANSTGRVASDTTVRPRRTTFRHPSTTKAFDARRSSTSPRSRGRSKPLSMRRAAGVSRTATAASTSAVSAGMRASRAARPARASAARAAVIRRRRIATPATTSSWTVRSAGGSGAGSSPASIRSAWSRRPIRTSRRTRDTPHTRR